MNTPRSVDIDITSQCNLRCTYCYHFTSAGDVKTDLPTEAWLAFFEELKQYAIMDVTLAGGEPLIRKDIKELISGIVRNKMRFSVLTNGTLLAEDMASFLYDTGRCNFVQVSIDGSSPAVHDRFRGRGSFAKAVNGIRILKKYHVPVTVRVTVHPHNVHDLDNISSFLLEDLSLPGFSTNAASCLGLGRKNIENIGLSVNHRRLAMKTLSGLNRKYTGRITAQAGPLAEACHWKEMISARESGENKIRGGGFLTGCGCVNHKIAVNADGAIVPCVMLSQIKLGRINQDNFRAIWQNHPDMVNMRTRTTIPLTDFEFCNRCDYISYCTGNCPGLAYTLTGKVNHPSPDACLKRFLENGGHVNDFKEI
ncbi:MAG: SynChlorMet cassette radical SAM/SPASM protein ScmE [Proteobacteria bacterium]|nr:SynChlorMet cassette radical SAM/SPASM protein ScmE [Pseudomonadota bacterium]